MLTLFSKIRSVFLLPIAALFIVSFSYAENETNVSAPPASLPEWVYKELSAIQKEMSVIDANGATKESVQELKERLGKVEVTLEESQLRVDGKLTDHRGRIEDIADNNSFSINVLSIIVGIFGVVITGFSIINSSNAKREAIATAKTDTKKHVDDWLESNKKELDTHLIDAKKQLDDALKNEISSAKNQIQEFIDKSEKVIEVVQSKAETLLDELSSKLNVDGSKITEEEQQKIEATVEQLSDKKDNEKTANDWRLFALNAYFSDKFDEALTSINKALVKKDSLSDKQKADSLFLKGVTLGQLEEPQYEKEIDTYDDLVSLFGENKEPAIQEQVAKALVNKGVALGKLEEPQHQKAIDTYDEVVTLFGESKVSKIQEQVARALHNKGIMLGQLECSKEAIDNYDILVALFGESKEPAIQEQMASALFNKGITLGQLERSKEAIDTYDKLVTLFGESKEPVIQDLVGKALVNKGGTLGRLTRLGEAVEVYDEVIERFKNSETNEVRNPVSSALTNKAELVLVTKDKESAKKAIAHAIDFGGDENIESRSVMEMLNFIIEETTLESVLSFIDKISDEELNWTFDEIRPAIEKLESPRKEQVEALVRFFEKHKDKKKLKAELDLTFKD